MLTFLVCIVVTGQNSDTVNVLIEKRKTDADGRIHLWYSILKGDDKKGDTLFYSVCKCPPDKLPYKGEQSKILRKDIVYIGKGKYK